jgi:hypothetical protein
MKTPLPHFKSRWFKSMQKYLAKIEARWEMTEDFVYPPQQLWDEHIMSKVCVSDQFMDRDIQRINYCRVYLNVTTLSNIVLVDGKNVRSTHV